MSNLILCYFVLDGLTESSLMAMTDKSRYKVFVFIQSHSWNGVVKLDPQKTTVVSKRSEWNNLGHVCLLSSCTVRINLKFWWVRYRFELCYINYKISVLDIILFKTFFFWGKFLRQVLYTLFFFLTGLDKRFTCQE